MMNPAITHELKRSIDMPVGRTLLNNSERSMDPGTFDNLLNNQIRNVDDSFDNQLRTENPVPDRQFTDQAALSRPVQDSRVGNDGQPPTSGTDKLPQKNENDTLQTGNNTKRTDDTRESAPVAATEKKVQKENPGLSQKPAPVFIHDKSQDIKASGGDTISESKKLLNKIAALTAMLGTMNLAGKQETDALKSSLKELGKQLKDMSLGNEQHNRKDVQTQLLAHLKSLLNSLDEKLKAQKPDLKNLVADFEKLLQGMAKKSEGRNNTAPHHTVETASLDKKINQRPDTAENTALNNTERPDGGIKITVSSDSRTGLDFQFGRSSSPQSLQSPHNHAAAQRNNLFREQLQDVIDNAKVTVRNSRNGTFDIKLNPKELGNVNVHLGLDQGTINGRFLVETNEAKQLLLENLSFVKEQLENAGISVGEFQVNVRDNKENTGESEKNNGNLVYLPQEAEEISGSYAVNSSAMHNGALNIVI